MKYAFRRNSGSLYVPPDESDAPRRAQQCDKGHVYSREVTACPLCAADRAQKQTRAEIARIRAETSNGNRVKSEARRRSDRAGKLRVQREKLIERLAAVDRELAGLSS